VEIFDQVAGENRNGATSEDDVSNIVFAEEERSFPVQSVIIDDGDPGFEATGIPFRLLKQQSGRFQDCFREPSMTFQPLGQILGFPLLTQPMTSPRIRATPQ